MIIETYPRIFVDGDAFERTRIFYRTMLNGHDSLRFSYPEKELEVAAVSSPRLSILIIAGAPEKRRPFETTRLTVRVDKLETIMDTLLQGGAERLEPIQQTPVGRKTRFRHPDGLIVVYVDQD